MITDLDEFYRELFQEARRRARKSDMSFELTREEYFDIVNRASGHCEVSGMEFDLTAHPFASRRPLVPSLDRIDSKIGYRYDNCRLVCAAVNICMNEWGEEILIKMVRAIVLDGDK